MQGDYEHMPFLEQTFDAAYAIEATVHARHLENPYGEIFRVLKPGSYFACYEWLTTDKYNDRDPKQKKIIDDLEKGNSISKLYTIDQCLNAIKSVGFELIEYKDLADPKNQSGAQDTWYSTLEGSLFPGIDQLNRIPMHPLGRMYNFTNKGLPILLYMHWKLCV
jgi:sterol 24-C-methyltransferase